MRARTYLSDLMKEEGVEFDRNTLILAPSGAGKSFFVLNNFDENSLLITTKLAKDHFIEILNEHSDVSLKDNSVMTYDEFHSALKEDEVFADKFTQIFCDEFHVLFKEDSEVDEVVFDELFEDKEFQRKYYLSPDRYAFAELTEGIESGFIQLLNYMDHQDFKE